MPVVTLAEIDATARKAARGCGCPWGLAEEAGGSVRWLESHGLAGAETLAAMLAGREACCTVTGAPCALRHGAALADRAEALGVEPVAVDTGGHPLLVLAQMGRTADALDRSYALDWEGGGATVSRNALALHGKTIADTLTCRTGDTVPEGQAPSPASRPVAAEGWAALEELARRTLVPATDASRAGAGAGTSDND